MVHGTLRKAALTIGLLLAPGFHALAVDTVRIATEGSYAPFNFKNEAGDLEGFEIDMANEACKRTGLDCEYVLVAWEGVIAGLLANNYDVIMSGMSITEEREKTVAFSHPYVIRTVTFVTRKGTPFAGFETDVERLDLGGLDPEGMRVIDELRAALDGLTVGVQVSTPHERFMQEHLPDVTLKSYDTMDNMILDLQAERIDASYSTGLFLQPILADNPDLVLVGPAMAGGLLGRGQALAMRKEDEALHGKLDGAIREMIADGTLSSLSQKWFGMDVAPSEVASE